MGGKSQPKPPDYAKLAEQTAEASRDVTEQQTWANRPDQFTPFGSTTWSNAPQWDPTTGQYLNRWTQTTQLDPQAQAALDAQQQLGLERSQLGLSMTDRMRKEYGQAMDWSGAPEMGGAIGPTGTQREISTAGLPELNPASRYYKEAGDALYNQWAERAMPQQQAQTDALRTQLYNQGLREGDAGFDNELAKLRMSQGDQQRQAAFSATAGAGQEASRYLGMDAQTRQQLFGERGTQADLWNSGGAQMFGQQQASSAYQNQLRQQFMAEQMQRRGFTLNEINALLTGQQVGMPSMPGFSQAQRAEGADYMRAGENQWGASMDAANLQQAQNQMMMSGITDLAGAGFKAFSDRRLKRDIKRIGTLFGVPIYTWHWIWGGDGVGVMADEVPWAIAGKINDYFVVDYGRIW